MAMLIERNWNGNIRLISVVGDDEEIPKRQKHLEKVMEVARMPRHTISQVLIGEFDAHFKNPPKANLNIFGATDEVDISSMRHLVKLSKTSCLFVKESGLESFMA